MRSRAGSSAPLDVLGGAFFRGASVDTMFFANNGGAGDVVDFRSFNIPRFFVASSGNVGVGTAAPNSKLHVSATSFGGQFRVFDFGDGGGPLAGT